MNSERRGQLPESLRYLKMVEHLNPADGTVAYQQVRVLSQLGRKAEALEECRKSLSLMPNDVGIRTTLIQLLKDAGETVVAKEQQGLLDRMQEIMQQFGVAAGGAEMRIADPDGAELQLAARRQGVVIMPVRWTAWVRRQCAGRIRPGETFK